MQEPITPFISWIRRPNDKESASDIDGLILINEGALEDMPPSLKADLIKYLREFLEKEDLFCSVQGQK